VFLCCLNAVTALNVLFNTSNFSFYFRSVVLKFNYIFGPISSVLASKGSFPGFLYSVASIAVINITDLRFSILRGLYFV